MSAELHPLAPHTLPSFIGAADGSDPLFSAITVILVLAVLGIGVGYLKLDIVLVYMVSTFAVTATGAAILAATEELLARREAAGLPPPELADVAAYGLRAIRTGELEIEGEAPATTT